MRNPGLRCMRGASLRRNPRSSQVLACPVSVIFIRVASTSVIVVAVAAMGVLFIVAAIPDVSESQCKSGSCTQNCWNLVRLSASFNAPMK
jgi:hypothetical protein